jgi:hypothetical protein
VVWQCRLAILPFSYCATLKISGIFDCLSVYFEIARIACWQAHFGLFARLRFCAFLLPPLLYFCCSVCFSFEM